LLQQQHFLTEKKITQSGCKLFGGTLKDKIPSPQNYLKILLKLVCETCNFTLVFIILLYLRCNTLFQISFFELIQWLKFFDIHLIFANNDINFLLFDGCLTLKTIYLVFSVCCTTKQHLSKHNMMQLMQARGKCQSTKVI
jgi:hypothetical protein